MVIIKELSLNGKLFALGHGQTSPAPYSGWLSIITVGNKIRARKPSFAGSKSVIRIVLKGECYKLHKTDDMRESRLKENAILQNRFAYSLDLLAQVSCK